MGLPTARLQPEREMPTRARPSDRARFLAALALFLLWIAVLGGMAVLSSARPEARSATGDAHQETAPPDAPGPEGP